MPDHKQFRLFLSSTFQDLLAEREHLVKKVFPKIRVRCRERGVEFTEIDLRWGITEEESQTGKTIRLCLEEIDRCPYFIGILGERYGWRPAPDHVEMDAALFERFPRVRDSLTLHRSIIDIEFAHATNAVSQRSGYFYEKIFSPEHLDQYRDSDLRLLAEGLRTQGADVRTFQSPEV